MTEEQQRIAIAEFCGWKLLPRYKVGRTTVEFDVWEKGANRCSIWYETMPNYLHDLNAMHEAEAMLKDKVQQDSYCLQLAKVTNSFKGTDWKKMDVVAWRAMRATPPQRAEALLRTVGKWKGARAHATH